jgi:starvation-inducible DNA-binding protein
MRKAALQLEFVEVESEAGLVGSLQSLLADTFVFYLKAHGYHWNVEGEAFGPFHELFGGISGEVYGTIDDMAEHIRKLGAYAPYTLALFEQARTISDTRLGDSSPLPMVRDLIAANEQILARIALCKKLAVDAKEDGLANYLDDRRDQHKKHGWFLQATAK